MTIVKLFGGDLGRESMLVRCDLSRANSPVEVNTMDESGSAWEPTQFQCADARHTVDGLRRIAKQIAAQACEMPAHRFHCRSSVTVD